MLRELIRDRTAQEAHSAPKQLLSISVFGMQAILSASVVPALQHQPIRSFRVVDFGALPQAAWSGAGGEALLGETMGINSEGICAGASGGGTPWNPHAVAFRGGAANINPPWSDESWARAINDAGYVVGYGWKFVQGNYIRFAYRRSPEGEFRQLWSAGGYEAPEAYDINDHNVVAGFSDLHGYFHAVLWDSDGRLSDLGTLPGYEFSIATAINNQGDITGRSYDSGGYGPACLWRQGSSQVQSLGVLPGDNSSGAWGINVLGDVVGSSISGSGFPSQHRPFLYRSGVMTDLGVLPGALGGIATSINASGQIVGDCYIGDSGTTDGGVFIVDGGTMKDLNSMLAGGDDCDVYEVYKINDEGQIIASGRCHEGNQTVYHAVRLDPQY